MESKKMENVLMDDNARLFQELQDEYMHYENMTAKVRYATTILKNIFRFLSFEDLKTCRFVCQSWDAIAAVALQKRSNIAFHIQSGRTHLQFFEDFKDAKLKVKCTSFKFSSGQWPLATVLRFIQTQLKHGRLLELELDNIILSNEENEIITNPCINGWIEGLQLKKISISCDRMEFDDYIFLISLDALDSVKELRLNTCKVNVREGNRLSPTKISLHNIMYNGNDDHITHFCLNDIIDFKNTECINISHTEIRNQKIILDLQECEKLNSLELVDVEVTNWSPVNCNIDKVTLQGISLTQSNSLTMNQLKFEGPAIDYSVLPLQLESFIQEHFRYGSVNTEVSCSQPINLPNLKSLELIGESVVPEMHHFKNCPNLTTISVQGHKVFNLQWLPKSVRQIQLADALTVEGLEGEVIEIDLLILDSYGFNQAEKVLQKIKPKVLKLRWQINVEIETNDSVLLFLDKYKDLKKVFIGPFYFFHDRQFTKSVMSQSVDRKAKFYCFEKQKGTAISENNFNGISL